MVRAVFSDNLNALFQEAVLEPLELANILKTE